MLLSVKVEVDKGDSSRRAVILDQPKLGIAREFLIQGIENNIVQVHWELKKTVVLYKTL